MPVSHVVLIDHRSCLHPDGKEPSGLQPALAGSCRAVPHQSGSLDLGLDVAPEDIGRGSRLLLVDAGLAVEGEEIEFVTEHLDDPARDGGDTLASVLDRVVAKRLNLDWSEVRVGNRQVSHPVETGAELISRQIELNQAHDAVSERAGRIRRVRPVVERDASVGVKHHLHIEGLLRLLPIRCKQDVPGKPGDDHPVRQISDVDVTPEPWLVERTDRWRRSADHEVRVHRHRAESLGVALWEGLAERDEPVLGEVERSPRLT